MNLRFDLIILRFNFSYKFLEYIFVQFFIELLKNNQALMSDNFTKKQIYSLNTEFKKYDANGDGSMTTKQLGPVMKSLGENPSDYQLQMLIKQVDADGSGTIDFSEFLSLMGRKMKNIQSQQQLKEVFNYFDIDHDGSITPSDLKKALRSQYDQIQNQKLNQMIDYMINEVDIDEDGKINFEEFVTIMMAL